MNYEKKRERDMTEKKLSTTTATKQTEISREKKYTI